MIHHVGEIRLVSPEYSFTDFCLRMLGKDPLAVIDAASAEIAYARRIHREKTKDRDFRKGSRGRAYCDDLQRLISLFMGPIPGEISPEFLNAANPLAQDLLRRWEIAGLRELVARPTEQAPLIELGKVVDSLTIVISREEVGARDVSAPLRVLNRLLESPETAREFFERVDIAFHGYDHVPQELFEIPEVRGFVHKLDEKFPFWLFFLSKDSLGLQCMLLCFLPPYLTDEGRSEIFPERIGQLLTNRWFPAMNHICEYVGFSEEEIMQLTDRVMAYITDGSCPR